MSGGALVVFALGLICGVGVAVYYARSSEESGEPGEVTTKSSEESTSARGGVAAAAAEGTSESSVDLEELMHAGRDESGGSADSEPQGLGASGSSAERDFNTAEADPEEPTDWLEGISGSVAGKRYLIEGATSVGRLARNDIQFNEGDVSRVHCRFRPDGEEIVVEALDTPNGTRVNDRMIEPGEPVALSDEDVIEVGKVLLMYHHNPAGEIPEGLGEESSEVGIGMSEDVATVTVDTTSWRQRIIDELEAAGGDISVAAQALGMDPEALERLADQLEID